MIEMLEYTFFRHALIGIIIISVMTALIGTYIVTRRMVFVSGGITHACFGGLGFGYWLGVNPLIIATVFAVAGALGVDWLSEKREVRRDSAIAVVWAVGMALGVLFISITPGNVPELTSFLFGNVLNIGKIDLWIFGVVAVVVIIYYVVFYRRIVAVSFDEEFAKTRGLPVKAINIIMTVVVSVIIVLAIRMIGIMLLMSLVSLPQLTAELFTRRYHSLLMISGLISVSTSVLALWMCGWISVPASAGIVLLMSLTYVAAAFWKKMSIKKQMRIGHNKHQGCS